MADGPLKLLGEWIKAAEEDRFMEDTLEDDIPVISTRGQAPRAGEDTWKPPGTRHVAGATPERADDGGSRDRATALVAAISGTAFLAVLYWERTLAQRAYKGPSARRILASSSSFSLHA
ncbi:hypothetical protein DPV78_009731 [Talaromyces pinophilus]|nr:hypothetical protein DPV78_009731 [Talaromyces pinophilus]